MSLRIFVASADPATSAALCELLEEEGHACVQAYSSDTGKDFVRQDDRLTLWDADSLPPEAARPHTLYLSADPASCPAPALQKPFRRAALLARLAGLTEAEPRLPLAEGWHFLPQRALLAHAEGAHIALTEKEAALLSRLLNSPGRERSRQQLLEEVWGYGEEIATHTLETHMYRLRAKLKEALGEADPILTTAGGYRVQA